MNKTKHGDDRRSEKLDQMIQDARCILQESIRHYSGKKEEIIDFIMENPDLPITANQILFILRYTYPFVNPKRKDYYDVLARLVSEAKALGDPQLVKNVYVRIPFFYQADQENQRKLEFYQGGIQYFRSLGLHHIVGELYTNLASTHGSIAERLQFCEKALEFLNRTSKEYASIWAMRELLCHIDRQGNQDFYRYHAFGGTIFSKGERIFLSPIFPCMAYRERADELCFDVVILKGYQEWYETMNSLERSGEVKEIVDEALPVGTSKYPSGEMGLIRHPDEIVTCQADGKEYLCRVFSIRRAELVVGDMIETHYYANGIGPIRTVLLVKGKEHVSEYVYDLCAYTIKGGDGLIPCCVGNQWYYRQKDCPDDIDQVIKREIIAQNGEEYLLSGWNYAGRNS